MDLQQIYNIIAISAMVFVGFLSYLFKVRGDLVAKVVPLIIKAEREWKDISKSGGYKFAYVCKTLHKSLPTCVRPFISYESIETMVQATFDKIERYSAMQLEQTIEKLERKHSTK